MKAQFDFATDTGAAKHYARRILQYPWPRLSEDLDVYGVAVLPSLLSADECKAMSALFSDQTLTRVTPVEAFRTWGTGGHCYFKYPMPDLVAGLRTALYPRLSSIANDWNLRMKIDQRYPEDHRQYLQSCHRAGQTLPTSMLSEYAAAEFSNLHQDVYGDMVFPLQVTVLLSQPDEDFTGGEFVITEQRPRMQTRPEVVSLNKGDAVAFAVSNRPVAGTRGTYRVNLRHGFSKIRTGRLRTFSLVFHDARNDGH
jgi:hypothetical protein